MTLFEAKPYDSVGARKRRIRIISISAVVLLCLILAWNFRFYPQEHVVDTFFAALQQKDYERAYGIWNHDPDWKQHPEKYAKDYPFGSFMQDWGPGGEWGIIKSYHLDGAMTPNVGNGTKFDVPSSGVIVVVTINERVAKKQAIWVEKSDKTLGFSPFDAR